MFGCGRCFSAHIERKKSKCDYHFDRALHEADMNEIAAHVNGVIQADIRVEEDFVTRAEAQACFNLERLPEAAEDRIRIIRIGDYDACPCIGEHVCSTGEIGAFRITTTSFEDGVLRIRFKLARPYQ
jgi:Ser-tRNA(Ala) deacylase AlaX